MQHSDLFRASSRLLLSVSAISIAIPAIAQDTQGSTEAGAGLQEIIVTAQRRSENLQNVPIAVSAITADTALKQGAVSPQILAQLVPGLQLDRTPNSSAPFMRGIGNPGTTIGNEPSIASYVDDIYIPNGNASAFEFNNIQAVEVLRGPQGTLFGRNAVGGLINVRTRDPEFKTALDASVGYANYDTFRGQVYANAALAEKVAANVSAYYTDQAKGWGRNIVTGNDAFTNEGWGVRAKLLFEPTSQLRILLAGNHESSTSDIGTPGRVLSGTVAGTSGRCLSAPVLGCQGTYYNPDRAGAGFFDTTGDADSRAKRTFNQASLKVRYEMDNAVLQSITAYTHTRVFQIVQDNDNTPYPLLRSIYPQTQSTFTQELQLMAPSSATVQWILGAFYYRDDAKFLALRGFEGVRVGGQTAGLDGSSKTDSFSGYAQATFEMMPRTNLTVGLRYTKDIRDYETQNLFLGRLSPVFRDKKSFDAVTGRVAIDHHINDNLMIYAAFNRGFKSGVFNISGFGPGLTVAPLPVNPEELNAYSAGFKSELFDRRLRLNVEGFYYDYKNIQLFNVIPAGTELRNAAGARIKGVDVDLSMVPVDGLTITLGAEVLDGHYTSYPLGAAFFPVGPNTPVPVPARGCAGIPPYPSSATNPIVQNSQCNLGGNETIQTSPFSLNLGFDYVIPTEMGEFSLAGSYAHRARYYFEADNTYISRQPTTDMFNASISWTSPSKQFDVRVWGNNITNVKSYSYLAPGASVGARYSPRAPRTYGVTAGVHF